MRKVIKSASFIVIAAGLLANAVAFADNGTPNPVATNGVQANADTGNSAAKMKTVNTPVQTQSNRQSTTGQSRVGHNVGKQVQGRPNCMTVNGGFIQSASSSRVAYQGIGLSGMVMMGR